MSAFVIEYSDIKNSGKQASNAGDEMGSLSSLISKKVIAKLDALSGADSSGYVAAARSAADAKKGALSQKQNQVYTFQTRLSQLEDYAKSTDNIVSSRISALSEQYKEPFSLRSAVNSVSCFFYNFFCVDVADFISDHVPLGTIFVNTLRRAGNTINEWKNYLVDFYQYGDGKYIMNVFKSTLKVVGAAIAICVAATASSAVLAIIGVVAGGIYLLYSMGNLMATTESNQKAFSAALQGDSGLAHYYGNVSNVKDWVKTTDFGDINANMNMEIFAGIYETTGKTAKVVSDIVSIAVAFDKFSNVYGLDGKTVVDHNYSWENIKRNMRRQYYQTRLDSGMTYKYLGKKGSVVTEATGFFNPVKFLFGKEPTLVKFVKNWTSDDPIKVTKGFSTAMNWISDFASNDKSTYLTTAKDIEKFISSPDKFDICEFISNIFSLSSIGGIGEYTGTYVDPYTGLGKDLSKLLSINGG